MGAPVREAQRGIPAALTAAEAVARDGAGREAAEAALLTELKRVAQAQAAGLISVRLALEARPGVSRDLVREIDALLETAVAPLPVIGAASESLARGEPIDGGLRLQGELAPLGERLERCSAAQVTLAVDATTLASSIAQGRFDERLRLDKHQGLARRALQSIDEAVAGLAGPWRATAAAADALSRGEPAGTAEPGPGLLGAPSRSLALAAAELVAYASDAARLAAAVRAAEQPDQRPAAASRGSHARTLADLESALAGLLAPMAGVAGVLERFAGHDLSARTDGLGAGLLGRLKRAVDAAGQALQETFREVGQAAEQFRHTASQIAASSSTVAGGASEQAGSLDSTTSSLAATSATANQAVDKAQEINARADQARGVAALSFSQTTSLDLALQALRGMGAVTQKNAAAAEQSSAAAQELSGQADQLAALVGAQEPEQRGRSLTLSRSATPKGAAQKVRSSTAEPVERMSPRRLPSDLKDGTAG